MCENLSPIFLEPFIHLSDWQQLMNDYREACEAIFNLHSYLVIWRSDYWKNIRCLYKLFLIRIIYLTLVESLYSKAIDSTRSVTLGIVRTWIYKELGSTIVYCPSYLLRLTVELFWLGIKRVGAGCFSTLTKLHSGIYSASHTRFNLLQTLVFIFFFPLLTMTDTFLTFHFLALSYLGPELNVPPLQPPPSFKFLT